MRRTALKRGAARLKRMGRIRTKVPKERGNPMFRWWIASHPCHICGKPGPSDCCHVRTRRLARGRDSDGDVGNTLPMCRGPEGHHAEQHRIGIQSFAKRYGVDLKLIADAYAVLWRESARGSRSASGPPER